MEPWVLVDDGSPFPITNLPYGVFSMNGSRPSVGVAIGSQVLDLAALSAAGLIDGHRGALARSSLNAFMAEGPAAWGRLRTRLHALLNDPRQQASVSASLRPLASARMHLPFEVADFVDFYSSIEHASNLGRIFRPGSEPLAPAWRHAPLGYHARSGTVIVSGTPVARPFGQRKAPGAGPPVFGPSDQLDFEAEVGFVVGLASRRGRPVPPSGMAEHVFGVVLVNDWSARDIQAWESASLGPFQGKSFATSISPWVVPLEALRAARVPPPEQQPPPPPYLHDSDPWALDLTLEVRLNGQVISQPPFATTYWTPGQQLAHLTANGASLRTGDLFASGTVSGPAPDQRGSMIELAWNGTSPIDLGDGSTRCWLNDGDTVTISAWAPGAQDGRVGLGEVTGTIAPPAVGCR